MGHRLSKIYTRTGDSGTTGLGDGSRVAKDDLRITALGDVDELNATIGVLRSQISISSIEDKATWDKSLSLIQHWLFDLGGEVCIPGNLIALKIVPKINGWFEVDHRISGRSSGSLIRRISLCLIGLLSMLFLTI